MCVRKRWGDVHVLDVDLCSDTVRHVALGL